MTFESIRARDPAGTKRQVLDAAERLFSERGFAGTSIRDIALASGVSHPLIQHHFLTKEGLYSAVIRRCCEEFTARNPEAPCSLDRPVDLASEMTHLFSFIRDRCRLARMVGWARLEGRDDLLPDQNKCRDAMIGRLAAGQACGLLRADIDAAHLAVMLEALVIYWLENRAMFSKEHADAVIDDEAYLNQAIALLERGAAPHR